MATRCGFSLHFRGKTKAGRGGVTATSRAVRRISHTTLRQAPRTDAPRRVGDATANSSLAYRPSVWAGRMPCPCNKGGSAHRLEEEGGCVALRGATYDSLARGDGGPALVARARRGVGRCSRGPKARAHGLTGAVARAVGGRPLITHQNAMGPCNKVSSAPRAHSDATVQHCPTLVT